MNESLRTAVAVASGDAARRMIARALAVAGVALIAMPEDPGEAMGLLRRSGADLLACDAALPRMRGAELILWALRGRALSVRPRALLICDARELLPEREALSRAGAQIVERQAGAHGIADALRALLRGDLRFCDREVALADALLDSLGVPAHRGRDCLRAAALACARDERYLRNLSGSLYPRVAALCGLGAGQVERAMRHAIGMAWQSDKLENQYRIFADTVDAGRGQPTCGEMISRLADILRLEG